MNFGSELSDAVAKKYPEFAEELKESSFAIFRNSEIRELIANDPELQALSEKMRSEMRSRFGGFGQRGGEGDLHEVGDLLAVARAVAVSDSSVARAAEVPVPWMSRRARKWKSACRRCVRAWKRPRRLVTSRLLSAWRGRSPAPSVG